MFWAFLPFAAYELSPIVYDMTMVLFIIKSTDIIRSGAAADRRTLLKPGAQLDLASPYAVPRTGRTESPTSLNYAKLCVELNYTGAVIGEMWGCSCHTSYCI